MKIQYILLLCSTIFLQAQDSTVNSDKGLALEGYDVVSYFHEGPVKGSEAIQATNQGVSYWFANRENRNAFKKDPDKYLPEYGGWCAYAMGLDGTRVAVDPKTYKIIDGKLYLFYNAFLNNTLKKWNAKEQELLPMADRNWSEQLNRKKNE